MELANLAQTSKISDLLGVIRGVMGNIQQGLFCVLPKDLDATELIVQAREKGVIAKWDIPDAEEIDLGELVESRAQMGGLSDDFARVLAEEFTSSACSPKFQLYGFHKLRDNGTATMHFKQLPLIREQMLSVIQR